MGFNETQLAADLKTVFDKTTDTTAPTTTTASNDMAAAIVDNYEDEDEDWHYVDATDEPAFLNSWENYDTGSTYAPCRFKKKQNGEVKLSGMIKNGRVGTAYSVFTLPSGYRPDYKLPFIAMANNAIARVDVKADGKVVVASGSSAWVTLEQICFKAS